MKRLSLFLVILLALTVVVFPSQAQEGETPVLPADLAMLRADESGIKQVFRLKEDSGELEQLSHASVDVEAYAVHAEDVAYVAGDGLFINDELAQELFRPQRIYVQLNFSAIGDELSYADETGLYILNLATGTSERLLEQVDFLDPNNPNEVGDGRYYAGAQFIEGSSKMIVTIGLWEATTLGVLDRDTGEFTQLVDGWYEANAEFRLFTRLIPLSDGRVLLHNSDGRGCSPCGLWVAPSLDQIADYEQIIDPSALNITGVADEFPPLYVHTMIEIEPGIIRIVIDQYFATGEGDITPMAIVADVELDNATVTQIAIIYPSQQLDSPIFSPDGSMVVGLSGVDYSARQLEGQITIMNVATGEFHVLSDLPLVSPSIKWAN